MTENRILVLTGALCGAGGVALSAMGAHGGGSNVGTAASFLLIHAPLLVAVGLSSSSRPILAGAWTVLAGVLLFSSNLLLRHYAGASLFAMAAPAGGLLMILGWLLIAAAGLPGIRRR